MPGRRLKLHFLSFVLALLAIPLIVYSLASIQDTPESHKKVIMVAESAGKEELNPIEEIARENLTEGEFGVVVKNLKTGESYFKNPDRKFDSASLYKLWVMAVAFEKIKEGSLSEDEILTANILALNIKLEVATPGAVDEKQDEEKSEEEKEKARVSMSVGTAIDRMITISDNFSAVLLASRSGNQRVGAFIKTNDFSGSNFKSPPETTARDIADFFEKLYKGQIIDPINSDKMIEILKKQELNDRIPKYLPEEVEVAHKTGELWGSKHDAGIVFSEKGDYVVVVMSETKNQNIAAEKIANFSKEVYEYFEGN